ncbi:MAG: GNAT family N-acetyltransferase [Actinomycetota bacterium]
MGAAGVRRAERRDGPRLTELMLEYTVGFYRQPEPPAEAMDRLLEALYEGRDGVQLVAELDGDLVGFATLYFTWSSFTGTRIAIMNDLYVVEAHRGSGVAASLFDACLEECRARGLTEMTWETAPDNHRAQRFYEKVGGRREDWLVYGIEP